MEIKLIRENKNSAIIGLKFLASSKFFIQNHAPGDILISSHPRGIFRNGWTIKPGEILEPEVYYRAGFPLFLRTGKTGYLYLRYTNKQNDKMHTTLKLDDFVCRTQEITMEFR